MTWNPDLLLEDFRRVAGMAGVSLAHDAIAIERCPAPHVPPKGLPPGTMAVYVFSFGPHVLKVGKVGPNSGQGGFRPEYWVDAIAKNKVVSGRAAWPERHPGVTWARMLIRP